MVQIPELEEQLLLSLLPTDEADQRDIVLEVTCITPAAVTVTAAGSTQL